MNILRLLAFALVIYPWAAESGAAKDIQPETDAQRSSLLSLQKLDQRITNVSWKIILANNALCTERMNAIGITVHDAAQYSRSFRQSAIEAFDFGDGLPGVLAVAEGGPADHTGLRPGDRITAIDGQSQEAIGGSANADEDYAPISAIMTKLESLPPRPVKLNILRGKDPIVMTIAPVSACRSRVEVVPSNEINANSNGSVVQIYGKLALWTKSDDELAIIIAHEMAHNILDHNGRIKREKIGTGLISSIGSGGAKLRQFEREADRYGLFMAARAGYDYRIAPDLWRRLANASGLGAVLATTHPTAGNRTKFNQGVVADIDQQIAAGNDPTP